jgi:hypothetical protein
VVGAGSSSIEAAVDLSGSNGMATRSLSHGTTRDLIVRSDFKGDLKLGNKMNIYD